MRRLRVLTTLLLTISLSVAASALAANPPASPGSYVGKTQKHYKLTFKVSASKRVITKFDTALVVYCRSATNNGPQVVRVALPKFRVGAKGGFDRTFARKVSGTKQRIRVRGDLDRGRLKGGEITYRAKSNAGLASECVTDGAQPLSAKRRR